MKIINNLPPKLVIPLNFEVKIELEHGSRILHNISREYERHILGEAWSVFWNEFIMSICHPNLLSPPRFRPADYQFNDGIVGYDIDGSDIHEAFVVSPISLELVKHRNDLDKVKIRELFKFHEGYVRPSLDFTNHISQTPIKVKGERLADAVGFGFNSDGEKEFGIVFRAALNDFYVEEGSLRATGMVALKFFATTLLDPLIAIALSTPSTSYIENKVLIHRIEKNISLQDVKCNVTGGFHFSRAELIMRFEHKLSVGGRSGICEVQSALAALGYSPGTIDGIDGHNTRAAAHAFASAWHISPDYVGRPIFFNFLARALAGEQPPYK